NRADSPPDQRPSPFRTETVRTYSVPFSRRVPSATSSAVVPLRCSIRVPLSQRNRDAFHSACASCASSPPGSYVHDAVTRDVVSASPLVGAWIAITGGVETRGPLIVDHGDQSGCAPRVR